MTQKLILILATALGALGVMIGAFGAHALKELLENTNRTATFETAVKYQMYHVFALLFVGMLMFRFHHTGLTVAAWCFLIGILIFSGSLYTLCLTGITWLGAITPIGGTLMIIGWAATLYAVSKSL